MTSVSSWYQLTVTVTVNKKEEESSLPSSSMHDANHLRIRPAASCSQENLTALREQAFAASPDIVPTSPRNRFSRLLMPHLSTILHDDDSNARALRSCRQLQHSTHSSHTEQWVVACARTAPLHSMANDDDDDNDDCNASALKLQQHTADDTHSWHSDVEITWHKLFGYTSDSSLREDTYVSSIITGYTAYLSSVHGGLKAWPEMYGTAVKHILNAVGNTIEHLTKKMWRASMLQKWRTRFLARHLGTNCDHYSTFVAILSMFCLLIQIQLFRSKLYKIWPLWQNVCQTAECHWKENAIKRTLRKRLHDAVEQLTTQNIHDYLQHTCEWLLKMATLLSPFVSTSVVNTWSSHHLCQRWRRTIGDEEGQLLAGYLNMCNCLLQNDPSTRISESCREADETIKRGIRPFAKIILFHLFHSMM